MSQNSKEQNQTTNDVVESVQNTSTPDLAVQSQDISSSKMKTRLREFKKAYMHAYLNIVSLPLKKNDEKETIVDRLYRYSDFPLLTQVFPFIAYRALEKKYFGQFYVCQVGINYLLQHFNYLHIPGYTFQSKENQMTTELVESLCLSTVSTGLGYLLHKLPHNSIYYVLSMCVLGVPAAMGSIWSRRKDLREGIPVFDSYLQIKGKSQIAARQTATEVATSRFMLGFSQVTLPLLCIKPLESRFNMYFYSFQKNLFFTELTFLSALFLSSATCAIFMPFGKQQKGVYQNTDGQTEEVHNDDEYYYFKGL